MTLSTGARLGPYEIVAPLGAGGMGEVYRARDPRLGREVAIKVLPASFSNDADRLHRFEREAQAAGALNHPNITAVHDIDSYEGAPYIVTELLEGETLRSRLVGGALSVRKAIDYAVQIAHGLAAAHEKGIVHRDLKPENLFVTRDGRVKILDFGLAKLSPPLEEGSHVATMTRQTEPGVLLGTVGYMSPEQARGQALDKRTDIWSFGCVLYEMLVGRPAFAGQTVSDTLAAILDREPDWDSLPGETPPAVAAMLRRCLRKDRERRLHDIADARLELEDTIAGGVKVESSPRAAASAARLPSRGRAIPWGIAAIALLLAAVATWRGERGSAPPPARLQRLSIFPLARSARVGEVDEHAGPLSRR